MRKKLQNSKGYAESPKFLPALGLFVFKKKFVTTTGGKLDPSSLNYNFFVHTHTYIFITYLPHSLYIFL